MNGPDRPAPIPSRDEAISPRSMGLSRQLAGRAFDFLLVGTYAAVVLLVALRHEPWRDEADVWLAARDMTPAQLFRWLGGAGTPGLWYLMVMPLAKLGLPYVSMTLLHVVLAIAACGLLVFAAPFPRWFKCLVAFSYPFCFQYAVVARTYVLDVLLLWLIAMALTARNRRMWVVGLLLFLLANANTHGLFIAAVIGLVVAIERVRERNVSADAIAGAVIAMIGGGLAVVQLLPPPGAVPPPTQLPWTPLDSALSQCFLPYIPIHLPTLIRYLHGHQRVAEAIFVAARCFGALTFLGVLYAIGHRSWPTFAMVAGSWVALMWIFVFHWYGGERHAGLLLVVLVFGLWVSGWPWPARLQKPAGIARDWVRSPARVALTASLCYACAVAALFCYLDVRFAYSGAKTAARFIQNHSLQSVPIASYPDDYGEALLPYLPGVQLWDIGRKDYGTYTTWNKRWLPGVDGLSQDEVLARVRRQFPSGHYLLLLSGTPLRNPQQTGYKLVFQNGYVIGSGEVYYLYEPSERALPG